MDEFYRTSGGGLYQPTLFGGIQNWFKGRESLPRVVEEEKKEVES